MFLMNSTITQNPLQKYAIKQKKLKEYRINDRTITTKNRKSKTIDWLRTCMYLN